MAVVPPPWPLTGTADGWRHFRIDPVVAGDDRGALESELWVRYPAAVLRESAGGRLAAETRAFGAALFELDVARQLCVIREDEDPDYTFQRVIARATGPVAELYGMEDGDLSWGSEAVPGGTRYRAATSGTVLREATIDERTGLPIEAATGDTRISWTITELESEAPPPAPAVAGWRKEGYRRFADAAHLGIRAADLPAAALRNVVRFQSTSLPNAIDIVVWGEGDRQVRLAIGAPAPASAVAAGLAASVSVAGRPASVVAPDHSLVAAARAAVAGLPRGAAPEVAEESADEWDERMNELVRGTGAGD